MSYTGFGTATMRDTAAAAGCSQGILHHYFANKEAMLLAVMEHLTTSYTAEIKHRIAERNLAPERLGFLLSWFFDSERFGITFCRVWMAFWALSETNPPVSRTLARCYKTMKDAIAKTVRGGIKAGEVGRVDPHWVAHLILESLEGAVVLSLVDGESPPLDESGSQRAELFMHYLT